MVMWMSCDTLFTPYHGHCLLSQVNIDNLQLELGCGVLELASQLLVETEESLVSGLLAKRLGTVGSCSDTIRYCRQL